MTKEQIIALSFYTGMVLTVLLSLIPTVAAQTACFLLFLIVIIGLYVSKGMAQKTSLIYSHAAFLIKSFWISSLFILIGMIIAALLADNAIIFNMVDTINSGTILNEQQMNDILMAYGKANFWLFIAISCPSILYLMYRCVRGFLLALKNKLIPNPKSWL